MLRVGRRLLLLDLSARADESGGCGQDVVELAGVRIVHRVFELAMGAQVVAASVGGAAQRTLEPAGKMDVIVVAYVRDHFAAQLATVEIAAAREPFKCEPHVPGLGACNTG